LQQSNTNGNSRGGVTQGAFGSPLRFPPEDRGRSLADIAQRDLDAALQLLADRAQYITGATGAAIALKRNGMNDMLCRASTGENAPELGALLSTEFGLSGESVRTRQALRCDDAERDARVNREVCRHLGIASVVVMPVVNDDEVLGVFELFSGKANAFGERDLSAVKRLTEMVQAAVRLAHAAESLPSKLTGESTETKVQPTKVEEPVSKEQAADEEILDLDGLEERPAEVLEASKPETAKVEELAAPAPCPSPVAETCVTRPSPVAETTEPPAAISGEADAPQHLANEETARRQAEIQSAAEVKAEVEATSTAQISPPVEIPPQVESEPQAEVKAGAEVNPPAEVKAAVPSEIALPRKKLFWSAALKLHSEGAADADQSHVPPVLRGMRKCEACGFPVSAGRVLCVECEEKKWRGQLRQPQARATLASGASAGAISSGQGFAAVAAMKAAPSMDALQKSTVTPDASDVGESATTIEKPFGIADPPSPELVLSAGLEPPISWLSSHKYVIGVLLAVIAMIVAMFVFR
jgi:hypothetical protein